MRHYMYGETRLILRVQMKEFTRVLKHAWYLQGSRGCVDARPSHPPRLLERFEIQRTRPHKMFTWETYYAYFIDYSKYPHLTRMTLV